MQVVPETQTVAPVHPIPPHWPYLETPTLEEVVVAELVEVLLVTRVDVTLVEEEEEEDVPVVPVKVELMGPHLMLEKVTEAFGESASTTTGFPESAEQVPRVTPGVLADFVGGYGASSQSMSAVWSSQMDMTRTIPLLSAAPMVARPPLRANSLVSPNAVFCAAQKASVIEFPVTPVMVD